MALAAARPDLVRALVLTGAPVVAAPGGRRRPAPGYRVARRLHRWGLVSDDRMERARQRYGSADYRAAEGIMRDVFVRLVNERYDDELAALRCPVELVWGDDDAEVPVAVAGRPARAVRRGHADALPGGRSPDPADRFPGPSGRPSNGPWRRP